MNATLRFALGLANVPDKDVADLEKQLPALARLIARDRAVALGGSLRQPDHDHAEGVRDERASR